MRRRTMSATRSSRGGRHRSHPSRGRIVDSFRSRHCAALCLANPPAPVIGRFRASLATASFCRRAMCRNDLLPSVRNSEHPPPRCRAVSFSLSRHVAFYKHLLLRANYPRIPRGRISRLRRATSMLLHTMDGPRASLVAASCPIHRRRAKQVRKLSSCVFQGEFFAFAAGPPQS